MIPSTGKTDNSRFRYVTIEEIRPEDRLTRLSDLTIDGDRIAFLAQTVLDSCSFETCQAGRHIQGIFFKGSPSEIALLAKLHETPEAASAYSPRRVANGLFIAGKPDEEARRAASQFLRKSDTLTLGDAHWTTPERALFVDSGSFAYAGGNHDQFKRVILIAMLGAAYLKALESAITLLTRTVRTGGDIHRSIALYGEMLTFNAGFYRRLPVRLERHELSKAWDAISRHHRIDELHGELDARLSTLAQWLREERDRAEEQARAEQARQESRRVLREDRRTRRIHTLLALISLILAFLALPDGMREAAAAWFRERGAALLAQAKDWL